MMPPAAQTEQLPQWLAIPGNSCQGLFQEAVSSQAVEPHLCLQVIMPGYCVQGTVGHKILSGQRKLEMEGRQMVSASLFWVQQAFQALANCLHLVILQLEVKMQVEYMSFSAHADAKGIMQLVGQAEPESVLLVHGEAKKMEFLRQKIEQEFRRQLEGREDWWGGADKLTA